MIQNIISALSNYLSNDIREILPGNYFIGKGFFKSLSIEIRYVYTENIFMQHLVDDVWSENVIWQNSQIKKGKKIVLYLCHPDINLEHNEIEIDQRLIVSEYFISITKYYIPVTNDIKELLIKSKINLFDKPLVLRKKQQIKSKTLSIITTVYNNALLLEQSIQSVINQTDVDFEYIIKDAGSTDDFLQTVNKYKPFISKIIINQDRGIYYGMHEGICASTGDYIACLNSDDLYANENIIRYIIAILKEKKPPLIYGNIIMYKEMFFLFRIGSLKRIYTEMSLYHPSVVIEKEKYFKFGGFNFQYKIAADLDIILQFLPYKKDFFHLNKIVTIFRFGGASSSSFRMLQEELQVRRNNKALTIKGFIYLVLRFLKHKMVLTYKK